jgi:hypothetical protein
MPSPEQTLRNRIGGKLRQDPEADVTELRRDLRFMRFKSYAEELAKDWPPPTPEQVREIAEILHGSGDGGGE